MFQIYRGHTSLIRSVSVEPSAQWLVSGKVVTIHLDIFVILEHQFTARACLYWYERESDINRESNFMFILSSDEERRKQSAFAFAQCK